AVAADHAHVERAVETIVHRVEHVLQDKQAADQVRAYLKTRLEDWATAIAKTKTLGYERARDDSLPLLHRPDDGPWQEWTCPASLREVEPTSALLLDEPVET